MNVNTADILNILNPILTKAGWLLLVIALDLILGVVTALKQKRFEWKRLADFLGDYGPKLVGWLALEALGLVPEEYRRLAGIGGAMGEGAYFLLFAAALASVMGHVQALGMAPDLSKFGLPATLQIRK